MPAMRSRRPGRPSEQPQRGRARKAPPSPPPMSGMPRLARIKLSGGLQGDDVKVSGKSLMLGLAGIVMFTGVAIAGATWLGSSLFDAREAFARAADGAAANVGFDIDDIQVAGVAGARAQEVRAIVVPEGRRSILSLNPNDVRARVEGLDWVAHAEVRRLWPSKLQIEVVHRQAYALWQEHGGVSVIDANGERLLAERAANHPELPLVVGAGAGPAAEPLLIALENLPQVRARLRALVRVGERRWNLELQSGTTIALPEEDAPAALAALESLHQRHALLDRPVTQIDLRAPGRMSVRVYPELAGGMRANLGGA